MHLLVQLGIILLFCLAGDLLSALLLPFIPGNIIAMLLLFAFLLSRWLRLEQIETVGNFMLKNMAFFFIPSSVGIIRTYELVSNQIAALILITIVSTILTLVVTGYTVQFIMYLQEKRRLRRGHSA